MNSAANAPAEKVDEDKKAVDTTLLELLYVQAIANVP